MMTLPVLVTGGELFGASLDPSGDMHVDDLSHVFVKTPHPSGSGSDVDVLSFVHVMTFDYFADVLRTRPSLRSEGTDPLGPEARGAITQGPPLNRAAGVRGPHSPCALSAASTMWALANCWAIVAAVSGKSLGSIRLGCSGQVILTLAGRWSGSTSSTVSRSCWPIGALAKGVVNDWGMADSLPSRPRLAVASRTGADLWGDPHGPTSRFVSARILHGALGILRNVPLTDMT